MAHIQKIEIIDPKVAERVRKNPIVLQPGINVLIGPNGSGKSTILTGLNRKWKKQIKLTISGNGKLNYYAFDFEKDNPRKQNAFYSDNDRAIAQLAMIMSSHGESVKTLIAWLLDEKLKDKLMLYDEPEQALDLEGLQTLVANARQSPAEQIIIATHSPAIILQPDFHVVELVDGYKEQIRNHVIALAEIARQ